MSWHREMLGRINVTELTHMICIKTELFSIGAMGRCATRGIARFITGMPLTGEECHGPFVRTFDEFNSPETVPKILVLRNPIERAISAASLSYNKHFHGAPFLDKIDLSTVTHILPFECINDYIGDDFNEEKPTDDYLKTLNAEQKNHFYSQFDGEGYTEAEREDVMSRIFNPWSVDEYDYTEEMKLYQEFRKKPVLSVDDFHRYVRSYNYIDAENFKIADAVFKFELKIAGRRSKKFQ